MKAFLIIILVLFVSCKPQQKNDNIIKDIIEISQTESKKLKLPESFLKFKSREQLLENVLSQFDYNTEEKLIIREVLDDYSVYYCIVYNMSSLMKTIFVFKTNLENNQFLLSTNYVSSIDTLGNNYTNFNEGFENLSEVELNLLNQSELQYLKKVINNSSTDLYNDPLNDLILHSKPVNISLIQKGRLIWVKVFKE